MFDAVALLLVGVTVMVLDIFTARAMKRFAV